MKLRPTIFLSGVSSEFASFRDAVETEVQKKDCFPLNQSSFGVDYRTIEEILRRNIGEADAVIHIAGFRFGFEPKDRPPNKPRRSYTQMEYDIARELNKPVYVFLSADATVRDPNPGEQSEDTEAIQLQLAHREALRQLSNIRYSFQNKNDLCLRAAEIPLLATADFRVDIGRIDRYAPAELIGREDELKLLDDAWLKVRRAEPKRPHILTFVALGGEGKTSLVAKWTAELAFQNWPGCDSAFAWSFYSQGSTEQSAASSDFFLKEAITFFGDDADREFAASNTGAYAKGQRLARIVGQRRALLILDGLEPLQHSPTSPTPGELKDLGIAALLKGVAADSDGLCIITTRYSVPDLKAYWQTTTPEIVLNSLSLKAGVHLLKTLGVKGSTPELEKLVEDVKGHALTLNLLGTYLRDAHGGDIRRRDLVRYEEADVEEQGGHAFRAMEAYKAALKSEGLRGDRALAILRLLGLFDRPVTAASLAALLKSPVINGLTEPLVGLNEPQINLALKRLEDAKLLSLNRESSGSLISLDAHPLVREYFARELSSQQPDTWCAAHRRMYEYLCTNTPYKDEPSLEDLQPLYQAVVHGCHAGLQKEVCDTLYFERISRKSQFYSTQKLGAFASDLGAVACFFKIPWIQLAEGFDEYAQAWLFNTVSFRLRALGRMPEALEPMRAAIRMYLDQKAWNAAAVAATNLSELLMRLGDIDESLQLARDAVTYADDGGDSFQKIRRRTNYGDVLHQSGRLKEADEWFHEAEQMQMEWQPDYPILYSTQGALYCDLLLSTPEKAAWRQMLRLIGLLPDNEDNEPYIADLRNIAQRAEKTLTWSEMFPGSPLMDSALGNLMLGRALIYRSILSSIELLTNPKDPTLKILDAAVDLFRRASAQEFIVCGLLPRACARFFSGKHTDSESAKQDLDEAWEIAERGPMKLHMADIHLYRARLFFRAEKYPWESVETDLAAARKLIEQCGYWRRKEELEDAERVILGKSV